ncbi:MAG: hypothetical protein EPO62_09490 [Candidatus Nitrosotenuis sp.]|nr:MAG: hypothetical protein EPO62_09490 [Candidatus Nitrosotenuis sp.]
MGITIGIFVAGLGIGYAINQYTVTPNMMAQNMQHMMQDQTQRQQLMSQWARNPQLMNDWMITMMSNQQTMQQMHDMMMNDPAHMRQMHQMMTDNPEHMQTMMQMMSPNMMGMMMNDPQMQQQMMNTMMQNPQFMQSMMTNSQFQQNWLGPWISNNTNWRNTMNSNMMNQGMMSSDAMSHNMMMGKPITKNNDVVNTIENIESLLDQISSKYKGGDRNTAFSLASTAYLENYEYIEGTIASKDRQLMEKIELTLRVDLRNLIKNGSPQVDVDSKIDLIKDDLEKAKSLFK